jgi:NAD+ kinase
MILPDTVDLKIQIPKDSRSPVWASFDGKHRVELQRGDYIVVTRSMHPVLTLSSSDIVKYYYLTTFVW